MQDSDLLWLEPLNAAFLYSLVLFWPGCNPIILAKLKRSTIILSNVKKKKEKQILSTNFLAVFEKIFSKTSTDARVPQVLHCSLLHCLVTLFTRVPLHSLLDFRTGTHLSLPLCPSPSLCLPLSPARSFYVSPPLPLESFLSAHVPLTPPSLLPVSCQRSTHTQSERERERASDFDILSDLRSNA